MASVSASAAWSLRAFLRGLGEDVGLHTGPASVTSLEPMERTDAPFSAEVVRKSARVRCAPARVTGFVDGIQSSRVLGYREHIPVVLSYVAAAAVCPFPRPRAVSLAERLVLISSFEDSMWLDDRVREVAASSGSHGIPELLPIAPEAPHLAEAEVRTAVGSMREAAERHASQEALSDKSLSGLLVIDGSLAHRGGSDRLLGVVKSVRTKYLEDESQLWSLPEGVMSDAFRIPAGMLGCDRERFSCYLRLHDATYSAWHFGMVRLEIHDLDLLEPAAAMCMEHRQFGRSGDGRWDRHLIGVRAVEDYLRDRRPRFIADL